MLSPVYKMFWVHCNFLDFFIAHFPPVLTYCESLWTNVCTTIKNDDNYLIFKYSKHIAPFEIRNMHKCIKKMELKQMCRYVRGWKGKMRKPKDYLVWNWMMLFFGHLKNSDPKKIRLVFVLVQLFFVTRLFRI